MAFTLSQSNPIEITVDARINSQVIINTFHYRSVDATPLAQGDSMVFLLSFRAAFRLMMLTWFYDRYTVAGYWLRQIQSVDPLPAAPRIRYLTDYDYKAGEVQDVGSDVSGALHFLPVHEALRCRKFPETLKRNYFKACYNRFGGWAEQDAGADGYEKWNNAFIANANPNLEDFRAETLFGFDPPAGNGWQLACFSPQYLRDVVQTSVPPGAPRNAAIRCSAYIADPFVGTQVSRRYNPGGGFRGK